MNLNNCKHEEEYGKFCRKCGAELVCSHPSYDIFCASCGIALKEKCPECGEMELIGRKICQTKLSEAITARNRSKKETRGKIDTQRFSIGLLAIIGFFIFILIGALFNHYYIIASHTNAVLAVFVVTAMALSMSFLILDMIFWDKWKRKKLQEAEDKFLEENPVYAGIIRQAEEDKDE
ncbi:MAG: hypothetical protein ACD_7C00125G0005 [uncultured bacterium]|nr:MAG: hypothetical protein ACD_7C00125G0005 [uncultured bacterium]KKP72226.1 MAG: hypothetical protein UR65_C0019G0009 [Candidatus Moranbacteria bacterium GW2011_GWE2_35_164]KKP83896.1 MAG: hypothetical protein UR83_C0031G0009 [Candidatus Moranbacteria bacterium GW2011_GWF2_35_54]